MKRTTPIVSGDMSALDQPVFFKNLGNSNVTLTSSCIETFGLFLNIQPKQGATLYGKGDEAWKL